MGSLDYNYPVRKRIFLVILLPLLSACGVRAGLTNAATSTPFIITATLPPTIVPSATLTALPPTLTPTTVPVQGTTSTQVNVRSKPSTGADSLGIIPPFVTVQVVGSDPDINWYEILYSQGPEGVGWVSAQFIVIPQNKDQIPVIGGSATPTPSTGTPPAGTPGASVSGTVIQQVNVRKGPGTNFDPIGTLNLNDNVTLVGKDPSGDWFQISYPAGSDGKGWVAASFIQASGTENLPIVGSAGKVIGTGTPVAIQPTVAPTFAAAYNDQDSAQAPAADVSLSPSGTQALLYSSDLSAPQGDAQDWIRFTSSSLGVLVNVTCVGNSSLASQVTQDGTSVPGWNGLGCGSVQEVRVTPNSSYLMQLAINGGNAPLEYVHYTLELKAVP